MIKFKNLENVDASLIIELLFVSTDFVTRIMKAFFKYLSINYHEKMYLSKNRSRYLKKKSKTQKRRDNG